MFSLTRSNRLSWPVPGQHQGGSNVKKRKRSILQSASHKLLFEGMSRGAYLRYNRPELFESLSALISFWLGAELSCFFF